MAYLMQDDGTGKTNGAALDTAKWVTQGSSTGAATYQSEAMRFATGTAGSYDGNSRITRNFNYTYAADGVLTGTYTIDASEPYGYITWRATASDMDYVDGYALSVTKSWAAKLIRLDTYVATTIGVTSSFTHTAGVKYHYEINVSGSTFTVYLWADGGSRPSSPTLTATDATYSAAGIWGISVGAGNAATAHTITFDDVGVSDIVPGVTLADAAAAADGTLTSTSALDIAGDAVTVDDTLTVSPTSPVDITGDTATAADDDLTITQTSYVDFTGDTATVADGLTKNIVASGSTAGWQTLYSPWDGQEATLVDLAPGTTYELQIRAVDIATPTNYGAWSDPVFIATAADMIAPDPPAAPRVAASRAAIQVTHMLGLAAGGTFNLPMDMHHLEVHASTNSGFVVSEATKLGQVAANAGMIGGRIPAVATFQVEATEELWVRVVAVDLTGNKSVASAAVSATALLIDDAHISDLTVSKLTSGTMTAAVIVGGSIQTAPSGRRVVLDATGLRQYNDAGVPQITLDNATGNATFAGALSAATGTFAGYLQAATGTFAGSLSAATGTFTGALSGNTITGATITGGTLQTDTSGDRVVISSDAANRIDFYSSSGDHGWVQAEAYGNNTLRIATGSGVSNLLIADTQCQLSTTGSNFTLSNATAQMAGSGATVAADGYTLNLTSNANTNVTSSAGVYIAANGGTGQLISSSNARLACGGSSVSVTSSGIDFTGGQFDIGSAGNSLNLYPETINLANIPGTSGTSIALKMVSRQLQWVSSARASKVAIADAEITPADALKLRPVSYYAKDEVERAGSTEGLSRHFGFIAEEVAEVPGAGSLVIYDTDGSVMSLGYDRVPVLQQVVLRDHEQRFLDQTVALNGLSAQVEALRAEVARLSSV